MQRFRREREEFNLISGFKSEISTLRLSSYLCSLSEFSEPLGGDFLNQAKAKNSYVVRTPLAFYAVNCGRPIARKTNARTSPARNPPMWAMYATPPVCADCVIEPTPLMNWRTIHRPITIIAGMATMPA